MPPDQPRAPSYASWLRAASIVNPKRRKPLNDQVVKGYHSGWLATQVGRRRFELSHAPAAQQKADCLAQPVLTNDTKRLETLLDPRFGFGAQLKQGQRIGARAFACGSGWFLRNQSGQAFGGRPVSYFYFFRAALPPFAAPGRRG